jgi:hypothetical protein
MKRVALFIAALVIVGAGVLLWWNLRGTTQTPSMITLNCSDSAGQQRSVTETLVGGVGGLVLPGSGDPSALWSRRSADGHRYFAYKAFLEVSPATQRYATVTIVSPLSAKLYYGPSGVVGTLANSGNGGGFFAAARSQVRLPVCGPGFTGFVGGIVVMKPTSVTFAVASPRKKTARVTVRIGNG